MLSTHAGVLDWKRGCRRATSRSARGSRRYAPRHSCSETRLITHCPPQIGQLHQVHHLWHYDSLQDRKERRAKSWQLDNWSATVSKVSAALEGKSCHGAS